MVIRRTDNPLMLVQFQREAPILCGEWVLHFRRKMTESETVATVLGSIPSTLHRFNASKVLIDTFLASTQEYSARYRVDAPNRG